MKIFTDLYAHSEERCSASAQFVCYSSTSPGFCWLDPISGREHTGMLLLLSQDHSGGSESEFESERIKTRKLVERLISPEIHIQWKWDGAQRITIVISSLRMLIAH